MATMIVRLTDEKHKRLKLLAKQMKVSLNKFIDELSTRALVEFDAQMRFEVRAKRGSKKRGLVLLDKLD